jgi:hypothetical protein
VDAKPVADTKAKYRISQLLMMGEEISIISVRSKVSAGVAYWLGIGSPVRSTEFDSPHLLHAGVAQVEEHRTRNAEVGVLNTPSGASRCSSVGEQLHCKQPMQRRSSLDPADPNGPRLTLGVGVGSNGPPFASKGFTQKCDSPPQSWGHS